MDLVCTRCGGPLPPEAARAPIICSYCGTTSVPPPDVVVVGRLAPMGVAKEPETPRLPCARCADWLTETQVRDTVLAACKGCGGVWLDAATIARLKSARDEELEAAARRIGTRLLTGAMPDQQMSIACPVCRKSLRRVAIGGTARSIDVCDAHGTWFDRAEADELQLFLAELDAARAGGASHDDPRPADAPRGFFARLFGSRS